LLAVLIKIKEMKKFDVAGDFTKEMRQLFSETIGSDFYNGSTIEIEIEFLDGFDKRNKFIQYLIDEKSCELKEDIEIYYWW
jgi:hypothetical protein